MSQKTATEPLHFDTFEAYLEWENQQPERHELHNGFVVLMIGGSDDHNTIADNVAYFLRTHFGGQRHRCKVYRSDMSSGSASSTAAMNDVDYYLIDGILGFDETSARAARCSILDQGLRLLMRCLVVQSAR